MRWYPRTVLRILALLLFAALPACAPKPIPFGPPRPEIGLLHGNLSRVDERGVSRPIPRHAVQAYANDRLAAEAFTDSEGWFTMQLPVGIYDVRAELSGVPDIAEGTLSSRGEIRSGSTGPTVLLVARARSISHSHVTPPTPTATPVSTPAPTPVATPVLGSKLPPGHGEIGGRVGYHHSAIDYTALPNHEVILFKGDKVVARTRTDAEGEFRFVLPAGKYVLATSFAGVPHVGGHDERVEVLVREGRHDLNFHLSTSDGTRCLPGRVLISTPAGAVAVRDLIVGAEVLGADGRTTTVLAINRVEVPAGSRAVRIVLDDGRAVTGSGFHPLRDGRRFSALRPGHFVDGARVAKVESVPLDDDATWDIATDGGYLADGVPLASTLTD